MLSNVERTMSSVDRILDTDTLDAVIDFWLNKIKGKQRAPMNLDRERHLQKGTCQIFSMATRSGSVTKIP